MSTGRSSCRTEIVIRGTRTLYAEAARYVVEAANRAVRRRGRFMLVLAGGRTPAPLYARLCRAPWRSRFPWRRTRFFWGDERWAPAGSARSNYGNFLKILARGGVRPRNLYPFRTDSRGPEEEARRYDAVLRRIFRVRTGCPPRFDLVLLGLGRDGHTASLFPGSAAPGERRRLAVASRDPRSGERRVTLTPVAIRNASRVVFLVTGPEKSRAVAAAVSGDRDAAAFPARAVAPVRGELAWFVDRAAASRLLRS